MPSCRFVLQPPKLANLIVRNLSGGGPCSTPSGDLAFSEFLSGLSHCPKQCRPVFEIRGKNLSGARVRSESSALRVLAFKQSPSYLFIDLQVSPAARPGKYSLVLETQIGKTTVPFTIEAGLDKNKYFQGIDNDDVIYLIMIDRFADGDRSNDNPAGAPPEANDPHNPRAFHGGDLRGIIDHLPYLKDLGVTALWLTPWTDNWNGVNRCDKPWCPNTYYHGYHAIDYYAVEDRFGDLATLRDRKSVV